MTKSYDGYTVEEAVIYETTSTNTYRIDGNIVLEHHLLIDGEVSILQVDVSTYAAILARDLLTEAIDRDSGVEEDA